MVIKIGDEVIPKCAVGGLIPGKRYKVTGRNGLLIKIEGSTLNYHHSYFNVTSSDIPSPIRTVTRREIVPGVYGYIGIENISGRSACVGVRGVEGKYGDRYLSPEDLREAAHLFNQIAEVLEENAG